MTHGALPGASVQADQRSGENRTVTDVLLRSMIRDDQTAILVFVSGGAGRTRDGTYWPHDRYDR